ncbi:MAG: phytoene desaturase family protein [Candidatus Freyarchaeota archaeon]
MEKYDAIVVGAGLGGLSAAATLAKSGVSVLLLEKHYRPGGYAGSFVRGRFEFEIALHELSGLNLVGKRGFLYNFFENLGITKKVDFVRLPTLYRSVFPDMEVTVPAGREQAEGVLVDTFPHEAEGISRFLDRMEATIRALSMLQRGADFKSKEIQEDFLAYKDKTLAEVINTYIKDPKPRAVISQLYGYFSLPPSKVSYLLYAVGWYSYLRNGPVQIRGTSQMLTNAFVDVIHEMGGDVRFNCGVEKITTEGGRVTGVVTETGEKFASDYVISNVNPITTCAKMIGVDKVPGSFFEKIQKKDISIGTVCVYMGLDIPHEELGIDEFEIFLNPGYDFDANEEKVRNSVEPQEVALTTYNVAYKDASPPGTTIMVLTSGSYADPWYKIPPSEYVATKNRVADKLLSMAENYVPGIREHIEVIEVSTPLTNMRYTGNPGGTIYGFPNTPNDSLMFRLPQEGPIKGLYFAGAWTQMGGGYEPCMMSGAFAAQKVIAQLTKK